jgi:Flp pilus assembly protein TadD
MARSTHADFRKWLRGTSVIALMAASTLAGGCASSSSSLMDLVSAKPGEAENLPADASELDRATVYWQKKYEANPQDLKAALAYLRNLRAGGNDRAAFAIAQQASIFHGNDRELAGEYGRLALKYGQTQLAARLLTAADNPAKPDWKIVSARGAAFAKLGDTARALPILERAHKLAPDEPSVINNLAMAYVASGELVKAENLLQPVALTEKGTPRMRQNLALVLGLQERYTEAKAIAAQDGNAQDAYSRIEQVRSLNASRNRHSSANLRSSNKPSKTQDRYAQR